MRYKRSKGLGKLCALVSTAVLLSATESRATDFDIVISEIHYNPLSGENRDEFVELYNRGGTTVDLGGWTFFEGIRLTLATGLELGPKEYLVVSPDAAHTIGRYGIQNVTGNYVGALDNAGEIIGLANDSGDIIARVHFRDGDGVWPSLPDGLGPSLERIDPGARGDIHHSWGASFVVDGTPGRENSVLVSSLEPLPSGQVLIEEGDIWRYRKGTAPYPQDWAALDFVDTDWEEGATGIGYDDGDDRTILDDMRGGYVSFAARRVFELGAEELEEIGTLTLSILYDDGFVAYLNEQEIARASLGAPGSAVTHDQLSAPTHEADEFETFFVSGALLREGKNVLAIELHNADLNSSDASMVPRLMTRPGFTPGTRLEAGPVFINEIRPAEDGGAGFVEFFNSSSAPLSIAGYHLLDSSGRDFVIPAGNTVPAGGFLVIGGETIGGAPLALSQVTYTLVEEDGRSFVDALDPRGEAAREGLSFGRYPDGDNDGFVLVTPSEGLANSVELETSIVINEFYYHPPFLAPSEGCESDCSDAEQWIELHNRGPETVSLTGWSFTKAVRFDFVEDAGGTGVEIPSGGYLVIASSRERFLASHPGFDPQLVLGDFTRALSHGTDTINLRDELENLVDHVKYGDGTPLNDEEPVDDVDDGTFRGSEWPVGADGSGATLELIHPELDNRFGQSWRAGPPGGTPGALNAAFDANPAPVVSEVEHSPAVPSSLEEVIVRCRVTGLGAIQSVSAVWSVEGSGATQISTMRDDGEGPDEIARDGIFAARIDPQDDDAIVKYRISVRTASGAETTTPLPPPIDPYQGFDGPYYLFQVLDRSLPSNPSSNYFLIMTNADQTELETRDIDSDALLYGTFISVGDSGEETVRNLVGVRYRGAATRRRTRKPFRVDFPKERNFEGIDHLNLNSISTDREILAADLFHRAGMPVPQMWTVNFTFQGDIDLQYSRKEHVDEDFLERFYGGASDGGNLYRALDPDDNENFPMQGDLSFLGESADDYRPYYRKRSQREEDDYSDIIELCRLFDPDQTPDLTEFADRVEAIVDVDQWARYFALQDLMSNEDGSIHLGTGEDYFLYHVPARSQRRDAGKWVLIPWDLEESFDDGDAAFFRTRLRTSRRFLTHERFAPSYYAQILNLRQGVFSRGESRQRFRLIDFIYDFDTIDEIDRHITERLGEVDQNIPVELDVGVGPGMRSGLLISEGDEWMYFEGTEEPPADWIELAFDDSTWSAGNSGFGYGDGDDATLLDMQGNYTTVYIRKKFTVQDVASLSSFVLEIDYDDGFVAYLNGVEIARRGLGSPGTPVPFNAESGAHEAGTAERIDLSALLNLLVDGVNVLAIQGVNTDLDSGDFSLIPLLDTRSGPTTAYGCGRILFAMGGTLQLNGQSHAALTRSVRIEGQLAAYDTFRAEWSGSLDLPAGDHIVTVEAFDEFGVKIDTLEVEVRSFPGQLSPVAGAITEDTTWTAAGSPYLLTDSVLVPAGLTLRIQSGTVVLAGAGASIIASGLFLAEGTEEAPILFRATDCENRWGGIGMEDTGTGAGDPTHVLRHVDIEFGDNPPGFTGCVSPQNAKLLVDSCSFRFLTANAVDGVNARFEVRNSTFDRIQEGVHGTSSTVIVRDSHFQGMIGDKDAIDFDGDGAERSLIEACVFLDGSDDGIDLGANAVDIRDNIFINLQDKAISLEQNGRLGAPSVTGNLIVRCGTAIALKNGVRVDEGYNNTLIGNQEGLNLFAKDGANDGGHGVFDSMIIWDNVRDIQLDSRSTLTITYSNVSSEIWPGEGNISQNPRFQDAEIDDYSLASTSPCIGTGKDGKDMGAIPFAGPEIHFVRGDSTANGLVDQADVVHGLAYLFLNGPRPGCLDRADANDDGTVDIGDPVYTLFHLYVGGSPPPAPFPEPGTDPTPDGLFCR